MKVCIVYLTTSFASARFITMFSLAVVLVAGAFNASATLIFNTRIVRTLQYEQTMEDAAQIEASRLSAIAVVQPGFTSATVLPPNGGTPLALLAFLPNVFVATAPAGLPGETELRFGKGTYEFAFAGPGETRSAFIDDLFDAFPQAPFLINGAYSVLQGVDPQSFIALTFNGFTKNPDADVADARLDIIEVSSGMRVYAAAAGGVLLDPGTLAPLTLYRYEMIHTQRFGGRTVSSSGALVPGDIEFQSITHGTFRTGGRATNVDAPASVFATLGCALVGMLGIRRRARTAQRQAPAP